MTVKIKHTEADEIGRISSITFETEDHSVINLSHTFVDFLKSLGWDDDTVIEGLETALKFIKSSDKT